MEYGRMIKVAPRLSEGGGDDEAVLYVVGTEDPNEATRLIRNAISIGSKIEDVGRVSRQLLASLRIEPDHFKRI
jgi:hypothetical protein